MTSAVIGSRLRQRRRILLIKIARQFVNLDMPDPQINWKQMLTCIGFVGMLAGFLLLSLWVLP